MPRAIKLKYPIQAHGQMVTELTVPDRLTLGHLMMMGDDENKMAQAAGMVAGVCGIPSSSVRAMDLEDVAAVADAIRPLLGSGGQGGTPPLVTSPTSTVGLQTKRRRSPRRNSTGSAGMPNE